MNFNQNGLDFSKAVTVTSGQTMQFAKDNPGVDKVRIELYWESDHDADASVLALRNGQIIPGLIDPMNPQSSRGMAWYHNPEIPGVKHSGDARSASTGDAPEETIHLTLSAVEGEEILVVASTDCGSGDRPIPFGQVRNCKVLVIDDMRNQVLYGYELDEDYSTFTSVELASFYKKDNEWRFKSRGVGVANTKHGLEGMYGKYA